MIVKNANKYEKLGSYRLFNMDGIELLKRSKDIDLILTSPPYNIGSKSTRKDGLRKLGKYDPKSYGGITGYHDSLTENEYQKKQIDMLNAAAEALTYNGIIVYNHKPRRKNLRLIHPFEWFSAVDSLTLMEEIIWDRGSTHNHSNRLFWPTTERLYVFRRTDGSYKFINNDNLKFRSDVWSIPLTTKPALGHAAPFPEQLANAVIEAFSNKGDLVCDPYSGSGTTAIASISRGREFLGAEISKKYHKDSIKRIEEVSWRQ